MNLITPCLWFDDAAEEAARLYATVFPESRVGSITRYGKVGQEVHGRPPGSVMTVGFSIDGDEFLGLNGGPVFTPTPAISFYVVMDSDAALDRAWDALAAGGQVLMPLQAYPWSPRYGWLNDRFGFSWQLALGDRASVGRRVAPALLFTGERCGQAQAALEHYCQTFPESSVDGILRYPAGGDTPEGQVQHAQFRLAGETFMAMDNAGPHGFGFNEAVSFIVNCDSQQDIDRYWAALSAVPEAEQCGWLKDRFGVSWQVAPRRMGEWMTHPDRTRGERVMAAAMQMGKPDMATLEAAFETTN
jgi:predicted 3-demethylubiquinone-9 3-methyltransferase (glyoxalase superfamily)